MKRLMISLNKEDIERLQFATELLRRSTKSQAISELLYQYTQWTRNDEWKKWRKKQNDKSKK